MQHKQCNCYRCTHGEEAFQQRVRDAINIYGFYIEALQHACDYPNHKNYRTYGISENFDHPELQICFPLPDEWILHTLHNAVKAIKEGKRFEVGRKYEDLTGCPVEFINAMDGNRPVLRLLVPDKNGEYPDGTPFGDQLTLTGFNNN